MRNKFSIVVLLFALCSLCSVQAQKTAFPFFDQSGKIRLQTTELDALAARCGKLTSSDMSMLL